MNSMLKWMRFVLACLALTAQVPVGWAAAISRGDVREVRILFTNNSNGKLADCNCRSDPFGGLGERVSLVREYRKDHPGVLLLDSGGYFGLNDVDRKGPAVLRLMDLMKYDVLGVGDQELYRGLGRFLALAGKNRERMVNASLVVRDGGKPFAEYRILAAGGVRIAVVGLLASETFSDFPKERMDFSFEEPGNVLARLLPVLRKEADYIVVLSQMGRRVDEAVAAGYPGLDLIIGGHSQTLMEEAFTVGGARIVQAGRGGGRVGEVVLGFDRAKRLRTFSYRLIEVNEKYTVPKDARSILNALEP